MAIRTALLSVSDKVGLVDLARELSKRGISLLSSGGTATSLSNAGVPVQRVEDYTGSPEVMGGRVKTLHPRVHGGILSRGEVDLADLERLGAKEIDLVVVNLYPFSQVIAAADCTRDRAIENIDIGGPSMIRSAAKNHKRVSVLCDPEDYPRFLASLDATNQVPETLRAELAAKAFAHTAAYDGAIAGYLSRAEGSPLPQHLNLSFERAYGLRYGENPHQAGAFYVERSAQPGSLARAESLGAGGKELSFNNLVDAEAALDAVREFEGPAAVVVKHTNPCGVALGKTLSEAYLRAREADALSAFGGVVALNGRVDEATAKLLAETFLEVVIARDFSPGALDILHTKKNLRLLATKDWLRADHPALQLKRVGGGLLVQERDASGPAEVPAARVVTERAPTEAERASLEFAWSVCKHVKSNAIVLAQDGVTVGVGAGQMSRVVSVQLACEKAGEKAKGSVLASDAFFPFPDGLEAAARAGVTAVAQPGGSVKDAEVIRAANSHGIAMVFTGQRHFRH